MQKAVLSNGKVNSSGEKGFNKINSKRGNAAS